MMISLLRRSSVNWANRFFSTTTTQQNQKKQYRIISEAATSAWLASGGDGRVTLHKEDAAPLQKDGVDDDVGFSRKDVFVPIGINAYGTGTNPRPEIIERSSCTSSSPRIESFAAADIARTEQLGGLDLEHLVDNNGSDTNNLPAQTVNGVRDLVSTNRTRLLEVLGLEKDNISVIMCASGTDAEMIGALAGIAAASSDNISRWTSAKQGSAVASSMALLSILMPETGSGVGDAAGMRHHSAAAPQAGMVQPGEPIHGVVDGLVVAVEPVKDGIDVTDLDAVKGYIESKQPDMTTTKNDAQVLLHAIAGSKTGMHQPPLTVVDTLAKELDGNLTVIIDACQLRVTPEYIRAQLAKGYVVLLTGSKFYGGPPFAGACLLPEVRTKEMEALASTDGGIPSGLSAYFTRDDMPHCMPLLRSALSETPNAGLALRWATALHCMERYHLLPSFMTNRVAKRWVSRVRNLVEGFYPAVEVLEVGDDEAEYRVGKVNTIVSIIVRIAGKDGGLLGVKGLKQLQLLLGTDLSELCDGKTLPKSAKGIASIRVQLGQPVMLGRGATHGIVRIALGATDICEVVESAMKASEENKVDDDEDDPFAKFDALSNAIDSLVVDDIQLLRKIELLATHWKAVVKRSDKLPATAVRWQALLAAQGVVAAGKQEEVTYVDIEWLKPHEKVVNQERVDALIDAISRWGAYRKPLLVDRDSGSILDGHHRYFAAQGLGLKKVPAALVDYLKDDSITVDVWPGDHGISKISKQDVIDMCLSADVFPPKTSRHTFAEPLSPIFVPLEDLHDEE